MDKLTLRFLVAGVVVLIGDAALVSGSEFGEGAVWQPVVIGLIGLALIVSGIRRNWMSPTRSDDDSPG